MSVLFLTNSEKLTGQNSEANERLLHHSHTIQYGKSPSHGHAGSSRALCQPSLVRWPLSFLWFLKYFSHHFHWEMLGIYWKLCCQMTKITTCRQERHVLEKIYVYVYKIISLLHIPYLVAPVYRIFQSYHSASRTKTNHKAKGFLNTHWPISGKPHIPLP